MPKALTYAGICYGGPWGGGCYADSKPVLKLGPWVFNKKTVIGEYRFEEKQWVWYNDK